MSPSLHHAVVWARKQRNRMCTGRHCTKRKSLINDSFYARRTNGAAALDRKPWVFEVCPSFLAEILTSGPNLWEIWKIQRLYPTETHS